MRAPGLPLLALLPDLGLELREQKCESPGAEGSLLPLAVEEVTHPAPLYWDPTKE